MMRSVKVGDKVRVDGFNSHAIVVWVYGPDKDRVLLDRYVGDFRYWNKDSLNLIKRENKKCKGCGHSVNKHSKSVYGITFCDVGRCICTNMGKGVPL